MQRSFGTPVKPLTEIIEELMIMQGNDRQNHYLAYLKHAEYVWRDLLWNTVMSVRQELVPVNKATQTAKLPCDVVRMVALSVVDECGNLQEVVLNSAMNALHVPASECSCQCGGVDTLCGMLDSIQSRREVGFEQEGIPYYKTVWNRRDPAGNIEEVSQVPAIESGTGNVVYETVTRIIARPELTEGGCIKATPANRKLIEDHCGCFMLECLPRLCHSRSCPPAIPGTEGCYGYYKPDELNPQIIRLRNVKADKLIVSFQDDGAVKSGEVMVPLRYVDAMHFGILYRQAAFDRTASVLEKREAERTYRRRKTELDYWLRPVNLNDFMQLGDTPPLW